MKWFSIQREVKYPQSGNKYRVFSMYDIHTGNIFFKLEIDYNKEVVYRFDCLSEYEAIKEDLKVFCLTLVPSYYKSFIQMLGKIEIKIYYNKYGDCTRYVDFTLAGVNLFGSYKLSELTLPLLCKELNKVFSEVIEFKQWMNMELRNYKIKLLTDVV